MATGLIVREKKNVPKQSFLCLAAAGGLVIITTRVEFLNCVADYKDKLEPYMEKLEKNGTWTKVRSDSSREEVKS